jgi:hypothetical protein
VECVLCSRLLAEAGEADEVSDDVIQDLRSACHELADADVEHLRAGLEHGLSEVLGRL